MKSKFAVPALFLLLILSPRCSFGRDAYITLSTGAYGHGFFRQFQQECYVITPKHVVSQPGRITVIAPGGERASAEVFKLDSSDLALLRIAHEKRSLCNGLEASVPETQVRDALEDAQEGLLHSIVADGSSVRDEVTIKEVTAQSITVLPGPSVTLQRGMSGSVLSVRAMPVGFLVDVDDHGRGIIYREEVVEDFWNRSKPHLDDCSQGCTFTLSSENLATRFQPSETQGDDSILKAVTTRFDSVYRVPEGWPMPPYFHVWQNRLEVDAAGVPPNISTTTSAFSFSAEPTNRAADLTIDAAAFDTLGSASSIVQYRNKSWTVTVAQQGSVTELQVSIKPWVSPYGFP